MKRFLAVILVLFACAAPVSAAGKSPGAVGAYMNFTRGYSGTPEDLRALINEAADAGVQFLIPYTRTTEGRAFYDSKIMPKVNKPYDALKVVIEEAHKRGMKVHPWFVVNADGHSGLSPITERNPDWCMVDVNGKRLGWLDPSSPEARQYIISIVKEVASNYDIDGLNLDYLRYATPGPACYCERCKAGFKERYGLDAVEAGKAKAGTREWARWRLWRYQQINTLARDIHAALKEVKPEAELSAYVWGAQTYGSGYNTISQDWKTWVKEDLLDWVNPMGYYADRNEFLAAAKWNREMATPELPMLVTLMVSSRRGKDQALARARQQIKDAMDSGADGVVFFTLEYTRPLLKDLSPLLHKMGEGRSPVDK